MTIARVKWVVIKTNNYRRMKLRTCLRLTTTVFLLFASFCLLASEQNNPLVEAIKLYDQEKYVEAEKLLQPLLEENPDQLMVNYYYGASRTENGHYGQKEIQYLLKGSTGESPLKTDYYLGVQYHALKQWVNALHHYRIFKNQSSETEQNEVQLAEKIEQCENHISPFVVEEEPDIDIAPVPVKKEEGQATPDSLVTTVAPVYPEMNETDSLAIDSFENKAVETVNETKAKTTPQPASMPVDFQVDGEMTYLDTSDFQTNEGLYNYLQWHKSANDLDSLKNKMDDWRSAYANATTSSLRNSLGEKIITAESELFSLQKKTKEYETLALKAENDFWDSKPETARIAFINELRQKARLEEKNESIAEEEIDTTLILPSEVLQNIPEQIQAADEPEEQDDLIYKIQIGAYSRGLPTYVKKQFDKLSYIRKIENYTDDRGVVVYTTGNLTRLEDAVKMKNQVRLEGIEDAFVVPYFNGKRITLEEAKKLEQGNDR